MQATTLPPRTADLFTQGLETQTGSALLRFGAARPRPAGRIGWSGDGAVAWLDEPRGHLWSVGEPTAAAGLALRAAHQLPGSVREFTGPRGTDVLLGRHLAVADPVAWVFRWTLDEPPLHPAEERVTELDETHHGELLAFLGEHSPAHSTGPGSSDVTLWAGIRDADGRLVACGAMSSLRDSGAPLMASVATDAALRGQGLGAALTSWLTRYAVRRYGFCTLWQLADNTPADRLYTRLGYRNEDPCVAARIVTR
ncbi:GNAT family N-acetyltransferase [Streptomyces caatingaensis]|uniref:GCN5 family acetyltransferase n=1 Tax=Streptomyces caatingaensis TaxID=1678637 RepID=A0A0K9XAT7_9ACTN|nr:GNAT family N-acetyltransferase [Streptomyces caatingaensis]KNB50535.1 GCN5 family acetyltransferase [Streptomyces caatingaensis]